MDVKLLSLFLRFINSTILSLYQTPSLPVLSFSERPLLECVKCGLVDGSNCSC